MNIDDPHWTLDDGFFAEHPERQHYARLMADGTTCVIRLDHQHQHQHRVFLRTYGLLLDNPIPESEGECEAAWRQLAKGG